MVIWSVVLEILGEWKHPTPIPLMGEEFMRGYTPPLTISDFVLQGSKMRFHTVFRDSQKFRCKLRAYLYYIEIYRTPKKFESILLHIYSSEPICRLKRRGVNTPSKRFRKQRVFLRLEGWYHP